MEKGTPKRFYIITGKGGVGKTTMAMAFTNWLNQNGHDATYVSLSQQTLQDDAYQFSPLPTGWENTPHYFLDLQVAAEGYIAKKLGSAFIAKWVVKTAFFRALVNMLPGFGYVISLGKMLEMIKDSGEKKILVLDAPASGHALTMLEATANFREIFQTGLVFEDTEKMLTRLYDSQYTGVRIITLPTQMAIHEAIELKEEILKLAPMDCKIFMNHSLSTWKAELQDAPPALLKKIELEEDVINQFADVTEGYFGYSTTMNSKEFVQEMDQTLSRMV